MRTPDTRRVRSLTLSLTQEVTAGVIIGQVSHTFQDDVRVIGVQMSAISIVTDAQLNADGRMHVKSEASKHGAFGQPGAILEAECFAGWTAAIAIGELDKREDNMFPEGYGMDFDDGEAIYLHGMLESIGASAGYSEHQAIVYYVER